MLARLTSALVVLAALSLPALMRRSRKDKWQLGPTSDGHPINSYNGVDITFFSWTMTARRRFDQNEGRAVIQDGGKTTTVSLSPAPPNRLVGKLRLPCRSRQDRHVNVVFRWPSHTAEPGYWGSASAPDRLECATSGRK
jgi:hypothetical protein